MVRAVTLVKASPEMQITCEETFAPSLYLIEFDNLNEVEFAV